MRAPVIIVLNRQAPIGLGGRVNLNPGPNEVRPAEWEAVRGRKSTQAYIADGTVVVVKLELVAVPRAPATETSVATKSEEIPQQQGEPAETTAGVSPAPPLSNATDEAPAPKPQAKRSKRKR